MTYRWLKDLDTAARKSGLKVVTLSGWQTRGRPASTGQFNPKGVVAHHTGDRATGVGVANGVLKNGRSGLPGPLCQLGLDKDGTVYVIAAGRANHAGVSNGAGFMVSGDGNSQAIGIEAFNSGSEGWSAKQLDAYYRLVAALCDHYGWSRGNVVGHGEMSTSGKWDPGISSGKMMNMNDFRAKVKAAKLSSKPVPEPAKTRLTDWDPSDFGPGKSGPQITMLDKRLLAHGFSGLEKDPTVWSADLQRRVQAAQRKQGFTGSDADGLPGNMSLAWLEAAPATPPPVVTPPPTTPPVIVGSTYIVRPGDTAYSISRAVGTSVEELATLNELADPTLLTPGMILRIKASTPAPVEPAPTPPVVPPPAAGKKARVRAATGNANVYWKGSWSSRADNVAAVFKKAKADVAHVCEMSTGAAGGLFAKHMGWGDASDQVDSHAAPRPTDSYDVHGGPHVGVKVGQFWNPSKMRVLRVHDFVTVPGTRNSGALAVLLQDRESGVLSVWVCGHLEFEPKGANTKGHWGNKRRYDQAKDLFAAGESLAGKWRDEFKVAWIPVFVGGDMNGDLHDPDDGPGRAAKEAGFVDSDTVAVKKIHVDKTTHANSNTLKKGGRIDRWFVPAKGVKVLSTETLEAYPETDHNVVVIEVEFGNDRP